MTSAATTALFSPPQQNWQRLDPAYAKLQRISVLTGWLPPALVTTVPLFIWAPSWIGWLVSAFWLVLIVWRFALQGRLARSWGYAELDTDLYITHGLLWKSLTVVPYGRMQAIDISSGPIARAFGLVTVQLITASPQSNAEIPGLDQQTAALLRDRLSQRGEAQAAGL